MKKYIFLVVVSFFTMMHCNVSAQLSQATGDNVWCGSLIPTYTTGKLAIGGDCHSGIFDPNAQVSILTQPGINGLVVHHYSNNQSYRYAFLVKVDNSLTKAFSIMDDNTTLFEVRGEGTVMARKIRAEEIDIRYDAVEKPWPDHVFDINYPLMSLYGLEEYLKFNKHLPGIPSEETVNKEGLDLGNFSAILLEKIEELTLYTINQQKEIDNLKQKLDDVIKNANEK